jgi:hypothetical protein
MNDAQQAVPVACNPQALSADSWTAHQAATEWLFETRCEATEELADSYAFRFAAEAFPLVVAFVAHERRCCPFLTFCIEVPPAEAAITLRMAGSPAAKELIRAELLPSNP